MTEEVLAMASGVALRRRGPQLLFVDLGTGWTYTAGFVLGLLSFILGVNGVIMAFLAADGAMPLLVPVVLVPAAILLGVLLMRLIRYSRAQVARPSYELRVLLVLDLASQSIRQPDGTPLGLLNQVRFRRRFQFTSSSPALAAVWPQGSVVLVKGNVFAGGLGGFEDALQREGFTVE